MKAFVRTKNKNILLNEIPEVFILNDNEVKIALEYSSFCRDDMRFEDDSDIFSHIGTLGHEGVGRVTEVGSAAFYNGFKVGDRVLIIPWHFCGECEMCLEQKIHYCAEAHIAMGTMAQYVVRKYTHLIKIPDKMTYKQAILIEPLGCVLEGISKLDIDFDKEVLVIGAGLIGIIFIHLLKKKGVKNITVIEPIPERQKLAKTFGADNVIDLNSSNLQLKLSEFSNFRGFDIAIETSSNIQMLKEATNTLTKGGTLMIFTYYGSSEHITFSALDMYASNLSVIWSSFSSLPNFYKSIDIIMRTKFDSLITKEFDFKDITKALEKFKTFDYIKIGIKNFNLL